MKNVYTLWNRAAVLCLVLGIALLSACKDDEESIPDYRVAFSVSNETPEAGEEVTFTNASTGGDTFEWTFGDGGTSTDKDPAYTYEAAGAYTVTLMVDGFEELSATKEIVVGDPVPVISASVEAIEAGSEVVFSAEVYNPDAEDLTYSWDFGATATGDDLADGISTVPAPTVVFTEAGVVEILLTVTVGETELFTSVEVEVKSQLAKTLIFSVVDYESGDGSLFSKKLFTGGAISESEDMNIPTNAHPLTVRIHDNRVYVFDAGLGIAYTVDEATADGSIFSADLDDPTDYVSILDFTGGSGDYTTDPFFGDVTDTKIYFGDRRNGVTAIDISTANATYTTEEFPYFVSNNQLGYYSAYRTDGGPTYGWGALNGSFYVRDNDGTEEFWWAKNSNHKGLWKFEEGDIGNTAEVPALGGILTSEAVRAFEVDETNQKVYFSINKVNGGNEMGVYRANLDGSDVEAIDLAAWHSEGGDDERTGVTGIAVDAEGGYVYWGYRGPADADLEANPEQQTGVKRWKIDGSEEVELYIPDVWVYGLAIDQTKK